MNAENLIILKSDQIFDDPVKFVKASNTLTRLVVLDRSLPGVRAKRQKALELLELICKEAISNLQTSVRASQEGALRKLSELPPNVGPLYSGAITQAATDQEMKRVISKIQKDPKSILVPVLQKSHRGLRGPTLLVNYQRMKPSGHICRYAFVVKWTERFELLCHRMYEIFLNVHDCGITTVQASGIDFATKQFENTKRQRGALSAQDDTVGKLHKNLLLITPEESEPTASHVMVSKRIEGENLLDFAKSKYALMNEEQKKEFFHRLGKLAMLDIIMGNLDRLVLVIAVKDADPYSLNGAESNLGNVMVVWSHDSKQPPLLYAIDNELDDKLVFDELHVAKYKSFLQTLLTSAGWVETIADSMVSSLQSAFRTQLDDDKGDVRLLQQQLKPISQDLAPLAKSSFQTGLKEMARHFYKELVPCWESVDTLSLKSYLQSSSPKLLQAVGDRIELVKSARIVS